jgi:hypothetical protein
MPSAKYTEVYKKVSQMGEKLKAAGKQGPSNDEQLSVRLSDPQAPRTRYSPSYPHSHEPSANTTRSSTPTPRSPRARTLLPPRSPACSTSLYVSHARAAPFCRRKHTTHTHMLTHAPGQGQVQQVAGAGQRRAEPEGRRGQVRRARRAAAR